MTMKIQASLLLLCLASQTAYGHALSSKQAQIAVTVPAEWLGPPVRDNKTEPAFTPASPYKVRWNRKIIELPDGKISFPGLNLTVFDLPDGVDFITYSASQLGRRGWKIDQQLKLTDFPELSTASGYVTSAQIPSGTKLTIYAVHTLHKGRFIELLCSAPSEANEKIKAECMDIISSLRPYGPEGGEKLGDNSMIEIMAKTAPMTGKRLEDFKLDHLAMNVEWQRDRIWDATSAIMAVQFESGESGSIAAISDCYRRASKVLRSFIPAELETCIAKDAAYASFSAGLYKSNAMRGTAQPEFTKLETMQKRTLAMCADIGLTPDDAKERLERIYGIATKALAASMKANASETSKN